MWRIMFHIYTGIGNVYTQTSVKSTGGTGEKIKGGKIIFCCLEVGEMEVNLKERIFMSVD